MGANATVYDEIDAEITTEFDGYDNYSLDSTVSVLTTEDALVDELTEGTNGTIIVDKTPFYATMGGQMADTGVITADGFEFAVSDAIKLKGGKVGHVGTVISGSIKKGDKVTLSVNKEQRDMTCKNHSATHLLQKALRTVLGDHVQQHGSLNNKEKLRFDFSHFQAMTAEEIKEVERLVNNAIAADYPVVTKVMSLDEARKSGAMALFDEKYGESVRVVDMGGWSVELCGGTHVKNTGTIGAFKILSESGISAGVRRIEAITSSNVFAYFDNLEKILEAASKNAKCDVKQLPEKISALHEEIKSLSSENEKLKAKIANASAGDVLSSAVDVNGIKVLAVKVEGVDMNGLRNLGDSFKEKLGDSFIYLVSSAGDKVSLVAMATDAAVKAGANAGDVIKQTAQLVGGGGGGRPNMAQAGGKNPAGIDDAVKAAAEIMKAQL